MNRVVAASPSIIARTKVALRAGEPVIGSVKDDRGIATIWAASAVVVLVTLASLTFQYAAAVIARHQAQSAADLAALAAAAYQLNHSEDQACEQAQWVIRQMQVHLTDCYFEENDALIKVTANLPGLLVSFGSVSAAARAGVVTYRPAG